MAVELKKGQKISLKKSAPVGEMSFNLNWDMITKKVLFFSSQVAVDLDLGCMYELKNGRKGVVQALGNAFGSVNGEPYIRLDGDDRSGTKASGETIRVNAAKFSEIERMLVFTFIYEGTAEWKGTNARVLIKCPGNDDVLVNMDEYSTTKRMCALCLLESDGNGGFTVSKEVSFFNGHSEMDRAFGWGLRWVAGSK